MKDIFQNYFEEIINKYLTGDSTELTLRTPFENFITSINENFKLIHNPKRIPKLGIPDFKAFNKAVKIGYIETKDLGTNLENELDSEQIKKYKEGINNIVLTNYNQFILIRNGQKIFDFNLFDLSDLKNSKYIVSEDKIKEFMKMIETFFDYKIQTIKSPKELALELSKRAKLLKDLAKEQLEDDLIKVKNNEETSSIYDFYQGIKELIKDIKIDDCVDAYAQTITYGLFLAKMNNQNMLLDRKTAASYIPRNIGIIKKIFMNISGDSLPSNISWILDELIDILNASNMGNILSEIDIRKKKDKDPFIFFYEDFLSFYDPEKKKHLGVYYTPRPVVNFIVNSVNQILKKDFNKPKGFAEDDIIVLDPAIGTGTFFWIAFLLTLQELKRINLAGLIKKKIESHLLKDFYGLEILITPYIISHIKLMNLLNTWFYRFKDNDRVQIYLTNTLEPIEFHGLIPFLKELGEENKVANEIKLKKRILVILGNPPYSVSSYNKSDWIMEKMQDYKKGLNERNIQPLSDDYIKFIRFAQWKIQQNQQGIVGYITNNSYLDGIIHRQMRKNLLDTFDRIYILNLHGNTNIRERCPDGSQDENVFDIKVGVSIVLFVKNDKLKNKKVFYVDLYGKREQKYSWLDRNLVNNVKWQEIKPEPPYYFFIERDVTFEKQYNEFKGLNEIFKLFTSGVKTHRDEFIVEFSKEKMKNKIKCLVEEYSDSEIKQIFNLKDKLQDIQSYRKKIREEGTNDSLYRKYNYRPFDLRTTYYYLPLITRHRIKIMKNFLDKNLGLVSTRLLSDNNYRHVFITEEIGDIGLLSAKTSESAYIFPLYIYNENRQKQPNFTDKFIKFIEKQYPNYKITPEEILGYVYAILHSSTYRQKFNEFLKIDFPRILFTKDYEVFKKNSEIGNELINLHLMKTKLQTNTKFDIQGSNIVKFVKYKDHKIYINEDQFFDGVSEDLWNFYIGGYLVLSKWLKSRKNRELDIHDIEHFLQIIEIIKKTIDYTKSIDKLTSEAFFNK